MKLLFYSHSFELNKVPYAQFIDAYGAPAEGSEAGEDSYDRSLQQPGSQPIAPEEEA